MWKIFDVSPMDLSQITMHFHSPPTQHQCCYRCSFGKWQDHAKIVPSSGDKVLGISLRSELRMTSSQWLRRFYRRLEHRYKAYRIKSLARHKQSRFLCYHWPRRRIFPIQAYRWATASTFGSFSPLVQSSWSEHFQLRLPPSLKVARQLSISLSA